jgi:hypothetical protein
MPPVEASLEPSTPASAPPDPASSAPAEPPLPPLPPLAPAVPALPPVLAPGVRFSLLDEQLSSKNATANRSAIT